MSKRRVAPAYTLTHQLVFEHGPLVCLHTSAVGRHYRLHSERPSAALNQLITRAAIGTEVIGLDGITQDVEPPEESPAIIRVDISGPIEQRAGYHEPCAGWSDGHDAIAERLIAALAASDVFLVIDSPGGAHAGLQEGIRRVLEAKAEFGRRITVYADEMIGSAAYWWAAVVGDEIYGPESMLVGSIGARAAHESVAGALSMAGVEVTYFAAPGAGKVAFAPELPLSELGKSRGERDVWLAFEAFASAVGPRRGLSRKEIIKLDADVLHGQLAVNAGLADGVASLEETMEYALARASTSEEDMDARRAPKVRNEDPQNPDSPEKPGARTRAADPNPDKPDEDENNDDDPAARADDPSEPPAKADKAECDNCGAANDDDAKYCDKCGTKMSADDDNPSADDRASEAADPDEPDDDKPQRGTRAQPPPPEAQARASSLNAILGLPVNASEPARKTAALAYVSLANAVMAATGTRSATAAKGALKAIVDDAAETFELRGELKALKRRERYNERMGLLRKLASAKLPGYSRGELFVDKQVKDQQGNVKTIMAPSPIYAAAPLAELRGLVSGKVRSAASAENPYAPSRDLARDCQTEAIVEEFAGSQAVKEIAGRSTASEKQLAASMAAIVQQSGSSIH